MKKNIYLFTALFFIHIIPQDKIEFRGPNDRIACIAYSSDLKYLAAAGRTKDPETKGTKYGDDIHLWNLSTGKDILTFVNPESKYYLEFSYDNNYMITAGCGDVSNIYVYNIYEKKLAFKIKADFEVTCGAISKNNKYLVLGGLTSGNLKPLVKIFDLGKRVLIRTIKVPDKLRSTVFYDLALFDNDSKIIVTQWTEYATIFDFRSGKQINSLQDEGCYIHNIKISHNGNYIATSSNNNIRIWDAKNLNLLQSFYISGKNSFWHTGAWELFFSKDDNFVISRIHLINDEMPPPSNNYYEDMVVSVFNLESEKKVYEKSFETSMDKIGFVSETNELLLGYPKKIIKQKLNLAQGKDATRLEYSYSEPISLDKFKDQIIQYFSELCNLNIVEQDPYETYSEWQKRVPIKRQELLKEFKRKNGESRKITVTTGKEGFSYNVDWDRCIVGFRLPSFNLSCNVQGLDGNISNSNGSKFYVKFNMTRDFAKKYDVLRSDIRVEYDFQFSSSYYDDPLVGSIIGEISLIEVRLFKNSQLILTQRNFEISDGWQ